MPQFYYLSARCARRSAALLLLLLLQLAWGPAGPPSGAWAAGEAPRYADGSASAEALPATWAWRELGEEGWETWQALVDHTPLEQAAPTAAELLDQLGLQPSSQARAVEMWGEQLREGGKRTVLRLWLPEAADQALPRRTAVLGSNKRSNASVQGRLLYLDRVFDLQGYTGASRRLPLRQVAIELRRSSDDSLMVSGSSDMDGSFLLEYEALIPEDLRLRIVSRVEGHAGLAPRVLDQAGPGGDLGSASPLQHDVLEIVGMGPGTSLDIGDHELLPDGAGDPLAAFNLLDCLLDLSDMLSSAAWLGAQPDSLPPVIWSPNAFQLETLYEDGVVRVASPDLGDDDSWADALVLAALGEWYLQRYSRVDLLGASAGLDTPIDPRLAYEKGAAAVLASLVRQHRASTRLDADGGPVDEEVSAYVDLGFPPPLGFAGMAQDGVDLESRELSFGGTADPRGQSSQANVAAMLWDLVDDTDTRDGGPGDDDPRNAPGEDGAARFHQLASVALVALAPGEAITYEDFHRAWQTAYGQLAALESIAVDVGRTALFDDAFEDDNDPASLVALIPWAQPEPLVGGGVVLSELQLGDRDWVELSNRGDSYVLLDGWRVVTRRNGFSTGPQRETTIPVGVSLAPGRSLVIFEGGEALDDDALALHDPAWSVPWREGADGACILYDDGGSAVDFARWDAVAEPSSEPLPPGQSFSGSLLSPGFGHTLSRDSLATDSDQASDFAESDPNPYAPNAGFLQLRSLNPATEVDHLRLDLTGGSGLYVLATAEREAPRPRITLLDNGGQALLVEPPRAGDEGSALLGWTPPVDGEQSLRLTQNATPLIATALRWGAWIPWDAGGLLAVADLQAIPRDQDPDLDEVDISWTNRGPYESLRLYLDGPLVATLPGATESIALSLAQGHHRVELEPIQGGVFGERAATGVYVGTTPRSFATGFEPGDPSIFDELGFTPVDEDTAGGRALLDHANPGSTYPPNNLALATLSDPLELTSDAVLRFRHAAHLIDDGDRAYVEFSADDGESWSQLAEYRGSDHSGGADPADWTDFVLTPGDWVAEELDLSTFAGARALIRFRRVSDAMDESLGWILDDVFFGSPLDGRIWISPDGDDLFGCGHIERPFASMGQGLAHTLYGDTLRLKAGSYADTMPVNLDGSLRPVNLALPPGVSVRGAGIGQSVVLISGLGTGVYAGPSTGWSASDSAQVGGLTLESGSRGLRVDVGQVLAGDLHFKANGTGVLVEGGELRVDTALFTGTGRAVRQAAGSLQLSHATMTQMDQAIFIQSAAVSTRVENSIFTRIFATAIERQTLAPAPVIACNDFYGFSGSPDVFLGIPSPIGSDGNISLPVEFCDLSSGDYTLAQGSVLLDAPGCGRMGAFGEGCAMNAVDAPLPSHATRLLGNHPNPFNPRTRIRFVLSQQGPVSVRLYDARGRMVRELWTGELAAGEHSLDWDATDTQGQRVSSGIYHLELRAEGQSFTRSMALLK